MQTKCYMVEDTSKPASSGSTLCSGLDWSGANSTAFRLEWATVVWMVIEAAVAIAAAAMAGSISLLAFGMVVKLHGCGARSWTNRSTNARQTTTKELNRHQMATIRLPEE